MEEASRWGRRGGELAREAGRQDGDACLAQPRQEFEARLPSAAQASSQALTPRRRSAGHDPSSQGRQAGRW